MEISLEELYHSEIKQIPLLTAEEEKELAKRAQDGDEKALKRLVETNLLLVKMVALRYRKSLGKYNILQLSDLMQEGTIGLMRAAEKFDYRKGYKFSTYATWWIRRDIRRAFFKQARTMYLPKHVVQRLIQYDKALSELTGRLGRKPNAKEIARAIGLSTAKLRKVERIRHALVVSITKRVESGEREDDEPRTYADIIATTDPSPEALHTQAALKEKLNKVIANLPEESQTILSMKFGLDDDGEVMTYLEIGKFFDHSRQWAYKKVSGILEEMRDELRKSGITEMQDLTE